MQDIVVADIGGTHARFAIARLESAGAISLGRVETLICADHAGLVAAWAAFRELCGGTLPVQGAIAVATPVQGDVMKMANNPWIIRPGCLAEELCLRQHLLINDFSAMAHAVRICNPADLSRLCGPDNPLPDQGLISIIGPGTGLGVSALLRAGEASHVIETEGGHLDFAPVDPVDDEILKFLRKQHERVSVERVVSGPGLVAIYQTLAAIEGRGGQPLDARTLWTLALDGTDSLAVAALDRFCLIFGSVAGDIALAQGAKAVVITGGLGQRIARHLPSSGFADRFVAKGRSGKIMQTLPVKLIELPEPGLVGAAAAFAHRFAS